MFLGDADVKVAVWDFFFEQREAGAAGHGGGDGGDTIVILGELDQLLVC